MIRQHCETLIAERSVEINFSTGAKHGWIFYCNDLNIVETGYCILVSFIPEGKVGDVGQKCSGIDKYKFLSKKFIKKFR